MAEIHLIGQILEAADFEETGLFLKYQIVAGAGWQAIEGLADGQTQLADGVSQVRRAAGEEGAPTTTTAIHSWSHPIDIHYATQSLQGWPRFEFQLWGVDWLGKCNISAYGFLNIPTRPGLHQLECFTWRPVGDFRRRLVDYLTGYRLHLVEASDTVGNGLNRHVIQAASMGSVRVELNVVLKDFDRYGIDL